MTKEFNKWWNEDLLSQDNPYVDGTAAFWAWEGWQAALAQPEQEPCGWQFFFDGKWANGLECNNHRVNTEAAGIPVRNMYPAAQRTWVGLTEEDEFNRIERESSVRKESVSSTIKSFDIGAIDGRAQAFQEIAAKIESMPFNDDTIASLVLWLKDQA
jgi:hypothetical protein